MITPDMEFFQVRHDQATIDAQKGLAEEAGRRLVFEDVRIQVMNTNRYTEDTDPAFRQANVALATKRNWANEIDAIAGVELRGPEGRQIVGQVNGDTLLLEADIVSMGGNVIFANHRGVLKGEDLTPEEAERRFEQMREPLLRRGRLAQELRSKKK